MSPPLEGFLVTVFMLLSAAAVPILLRRSALPPNRKRLFFAAILFSVVVKLALAATGHNYDMGSWRTIAGIEAQGRSVYANTDLVAWGPVWPWTVSGLLWLSKLLHIHSGEGFHVMVALFLASVDALIGVTLALAYSSTAALVFLLSPVSILISGFHAQFDNLAILAALLAWVIIREGRPSVGAAVSSALLAGLSLATKQFLFLFPVWLLFWKPLGKLRLRILYAAIVFAVFFCSFSPWWLDPASRAGILHNVLEYSGRYYGETLLRLVVHAFEHIANPGAILPFIPEGKGLQVFWMLALLVIGAISARRNTRDLFLLYILAMYALSPAFADQYMAIPMVACAVLYRQWPSWGFLAAATGLLLVSHYGVLGTFYYELFHGQRSIAVVLMVYAQMYFLVLSEASAGALMFVEWHRKAEPTQAKAVLSNPLDQGVTDCETSATTAFP